MKKILVTTDFSAQSKAAMRFAIQVASQGGATLTFLHVCHIPRPTVWNEATYTNHEKTELDAVGKQLSRFVKSVYDSQRSSAATYTCVAVNAPFVESTIMGYATDHAFDYVCMSTHGAGAVDKLLGTTTSNLINQSPVPVIAVPARYRATKLNNVLYASDLTQINEIKRVADFAELLSSTIESVHFSEPSEPTIDPEIITVALKKHTDHPVVVHRQPRHIARSLTADIEAFVKTHKPAVLVMFTTQQEGFFNRLFLSGHSIDVSFLTKTPLVVFAKA